MASFQSYYLVPKLIMTLSYLMISGEILGSRVLYKILHTYLSNSLEFGILQ